MNINETKGHMAKEAYLGVDIGGTYVKWGLIDADGNFLNSGSYETSVDEGREFFLSNLCALIEAHPDVSGIGICTPGVIDTNKGMILNGIANIPYLHGFGVKSYIYEKTGRNIELINDVNAAALGESWIGAGEGCKSILCITLGTGIGGSLLIDGKVYEGHNFHAGELGYLNYTKEGDCLEKNCSAKALLDLSKKALNKQDLTSDELFKHILEKQPEILNVYQTWIDTLSTAIANILIIFDPQLLIIGGGITERGDVFLNPLKEAIFNKMPDDLTNNYRIELAYCMNKAGIIGAVKHYLIKQGM